MTGIEIEPTMARMDTLTRQSARRPASPEEKALLSLTGDLSALPAALNHLNTGRTVFRPDLFDCCCQAARVAAGGRTLTEAAKIVHAGSTLLLKGLEADHAVVFDADDMTGQDLYVAISRGSRSLTVVSRSPILPVNTLL
jgi:DNA helicase-2/ATP-dependent DNA helicase PcrA